MKKILIAALAALALVVGLVTATPASATTVTLFSVSTGGWASGYHSSSFGAPYEDYAITVTYSGSATACNHGADHFIVYTTDYWYGGQTQVIDVSSYGGTWGTSSTQTVYTTVDDAAFVPTERQYIKWYVGPDTGCHISVRVWDQV